MEQKTAENDRNVCIVTFGCQMNKLDSELLTGALRERGFCPTPKPEDASIVLYNTCSVREHAEARVMSHLGSCRARAERDPAFILGVIGCMAERLGEKLTRQFDFVRLVCGTRSFLAIPDYLMLIRSGERRRIVALKGEFPIGYERLPSARPERHHAYVAIMRGCNRFCAYCIVPHVRGGEISRPPDHIVTEVQRLVDDGVREVTLLGQNVNSYGRDLGVEACLPRLLERLNGLSGLERIRFITNHPADMTAEIFRAVAGLDKVCEHVHMPAQSGSDGILERMNRGYSSAHYRGLVDSAREIIRGVAIASDFIVGFPGESEADFQKTLDLLREVGFQQSFIFKYSARPGTAAAKLSDDVPAGVKKGRHAALLAAQQEVDAHRRAGLVGETTEVLVDGISKNDPDKLSARTRQNDIVILRAPQATIGTLGHVRIVDSTPRTLFGELVT